MTNKKSKPKCRWCGKGGRLKWYFIADDLEHPKAYHKKCFEKFFNEVIKRIYEQDI